MNRISVAKTYKQYIGGAFVRSESGRTMTRQGLTVCQGSRKDVRDAVGAARSAFPAWSARTAYNRGQILYRIAEMLEARQQEIAHIIEAETGREQEDCDREVTAAIDRLVYYAGWTDKYVAVLGSVNPIADRYFGFTFPEPMGVVGVVADQTPLIGLVSQLIPVVASGNTVVLLSSEQAPATACVFAEILATSDVPAGIINVITGESIDLIPVLAKHRDINAIDYRSGMAETEKLVTFEAADNLKRLVIAPQRTSSDWYEASGQGVAFIESFVEYKSVWHPIGV